MYHRIQTIRNLHNKFKDSKLMEYCELLHLCTSSSTVVLYSRYYNPFYIQELQTNLMKNEDFIMDENIKGLIIKNDSDNSMKLIAPPLTNVSYFQELVHDKLFVFKQTQTVLFKEINHLIEKLNTLTEIEFFTIIKDLLHEMMKNTKYYLGKLIIYLIYQEIIHPESFYFVRGIYVKFRNFLVELKYKYDIQLFKATYDIKIMKNEIYDILCELYYFYFFVVWLFVAIISVVRLYIKNIWFINQIKISC